MIILAFDDGWAELNNGYRYQNTVSKVACIDLSLIDYLLQAWPSSGSREEWDTRILEGKVLINGQAMPRFTKLRSNDNVVYHRAPYSEPPSPHFLELIYQDQDFMAINKPSGLQVLPRGPFLQRTALEILKIHAQRQGLPPPAPVNMTEWPCASPIDDKPGWIRLRATLPDGLRTPQEIKSASTLATPSQREQTGLVSRSTTLTTTGPTTTSPTSGSYSKEALTAIPREPGTVITTTR